MQRYYGIAQDINGNVIPSCAVAVTLAGTATSATLYSDNSFTPLANPFTSETDGAYQFYARNGRYDVVLTKTGSTFDNDDTANVVLFDRSSVLTPAQITSTQNDYAPTNGLNVSIWRLSSDAARTITGITAGFAGQFLTIHNIGSFILTFANSNGGSAAANRIITGSGSDLALGADGTLDIVYDAVTSRWRVVSSVAGTAVPATGIFTSPGAIVGLHLSNNALDLVNDIDVAFGAATSDDSTVADRDTMQTANITKQLDVNWAVGTNQGMLDTGVIGNNTYHIFLIKRTDTNVVDVLASLSATAPTMPANYNKKRRIGSIIRSGGTILEFSQFGDEFLFKTIPALNIDAATFSTVVQNATLSVPSGIKVQAILNVGASNAAVPNQIYLFSNDQNDGAASGTVSPLGTVSMLVANFLTTSRVVIRTNTSQQIRLVSSAANTTIKICVLGWWDTRDKDV